MNTKLYEGARVTVLGLGLHGGGIETVRYLHRHGAQITVTDLRSEEQLAPSLRRIEGMADRVVLGLHNEEDIVDSDFVVKNPAVPRSAPILKSARQVRTDISLFFEAWSGLCIAVTGSKGKSTVSSMIHYALLQTDPRARLGGNITVSPLSFVDEISTDTPVVLELSSFQLGDLRFAAESGAAVRFRPQVAIITNIYHDHQDYYRGSMEAYVRDKERIFETMPDDGTLILGSSDSWAARFESRASVRVLRAGAIVPEDSTDTVPTPLQQNRTIAVAALKSIGFDADATQELLVGFRGIEHRFEEVCSTGRVTVINDSAATVPEACAAAVRSAGIDTVLIAGGTDKMLDVSPFREIAQRCRHLVLLKGSATSRVQNLLGPEGLTYHGPFESLEDALNEAVQLVNRSNCSRLLFSPGCASFELFENEFDRGRQFKKLVEAVRADLE